METTTAVRITPLSLVTWIAAPLAATCVFWTCFGACVMPPPPADEPPQARLVAAWDPLACGEPHRVVVELEDDAGVPLSVSAPCVLGSLTLDAPHLGIYHGRIYAWILGEAIRSIAPVVLSIDAPIVQWVVPTPR